MEQTPRVCPRARTQSHEGSVTLIGQLKRVCLIHAKVPTCLTVLFCLLYVHIPSQARRLSRPIPRKINKTHENSCQSQDSDIEGKLLSASLCLNLDKEPRLTVRTTEQQYSKCNQRFFFSLFSKCQLILFYSILTVLTRLTFIATVAGVGLEL